MNFTDVELRNRLQNSVVKDFSYYMNLERRQYKEGINGLPSIYTYYQRLYDNVYNYTHVVKSRYHIVDPYTLNESSLNCALAARGNYLYIYNSIHCLSKIYNIFPIYIIIVDIEAEEFIQNFRGELINEAEMIYRDDILHQGGRTIQLNHLCYLDCMHTIDCTASFANDPTNAFDVDNTPAVVNSRLVVSNQIFGLVRLKTTEFIPKDKEIFFRYNDEYRFPNLNY